MVGIRKAENKGPYKEVEPVGLFYTEEGVHVHSTRGLSVFTNNHFSAGKYI